MERSLGEGFRIAVEEKRAVALLAGDPPLALARDGTILGPATAADLVWAGAGDLLLAHGVPRTNTDRTDRAPLAGQVAARLAARPALDRLASELDVSDGPFRLRVVLRSPPFAAPLEVLLTEADFLVGLERAAGLAPDLLDRWPGLSRIDARVPDRLLVRFGPAEQAPGRAVDPAGGPT